MLPVQSSPHLFVIATLNDGYSLLIGNSKKRKSETLNFDIKVDKLTQISIHQAFVCIQIEENLRLFKKSHNIDRHERHFCFPAFTWGIPKSISLIQDFLVIHNQNSSTTIFVSLQDQTGVVVHTCDLSFAEVRLGKLRGCQGMISLSCLTELLSIRKTADSHQMIEEPTASV